MPTNKPEMVSYAIVSKTTSVVLSVGRTDAESLPFIVSDEDVIYPISSDITDNRFRYDRETETFVPLPDYPGGRAEWNGTEWVDIDDEATVLLDQKAFVTSSVNKYVGQIRAKYITCIEGQEMLYLDKEREAVAFLSDPEPDLANYPFLSREVGVTATTAQELAQVWLNSAFIWRQVAAELEKQRFEALNAIAVATTYDEVETVFEQFKTDVSMF